MVAFENKCPEHKKRNLIEEFKPQLSAFTNYLLSIPISEIENTLKGLGNSSSLSPTAWESLIRSDGLAAWMNDHLIHDRESSTRIGSNSREWTDEDEYNPVRSSLYGSYTLYCRQTNRNAKTLQNFSAELLEQARRVLGWDIEKGKIKIAGKSVRVIKGLKLRSPEDDEPTVEEILEGDNLGDNRGTTKGDNPKPSPEAERDKGDNLIKKSEQIKNNFFTTCDNLETVIISFQVEDLFAFPPSIPSHSINQVERQIESDSSKIVTGSQEVEKELSRNSRQVVPSVATPVNKEVEVVPQAVPQVVPSVVPPSEIEDFSSEDIEGLANLLRDCGGLAEFEKTFYPNGVDAPFVSRTNLNLAVKKLSTEKYEQIKSWVKSIKSKSLFTSETLVEKESPDQESDYQV